MALNKSGTSGSNVLKLDDIRNKQKKTKQANNRQSHSPNEEEAHVSADGFETDAQAQIHTKTTELPSSAGNNEEKNDPGIIKTPAKRSLVSNRRFDKVKVERIKAEIANGEYEINHLQVADRFIEHERFG